jgi:hypothetical protein
MKFMLVIFLELGLLVDEIVKSSQLLLSLDAVVLDLLHDLLSLLEVLLLLQLIIWMILLLERRVSSGWSHIVEAVSLLIWR